MPGAPPPPPSGGRPIPDWQPSPTVVDLTAFKCEKAFMIRTVLTYPDPRLRLKAEPVASVTPELQALASDMLETMYAERGIGLAATQIGELVRLLVVDTRPRDESRYENEDQTQLESQVTQPIVIFNPEITFKQGKTTFEEGCLSVPSYFETVERFELVTVEGLDRNGNKLKIHTDGLLAICLQHEMDHLDGKLFIDRLSLIKGNKIKNKIKKHGYPDKSKRDDREEPEL